jgi:hypothetical protein
MNAIRAFDSRWRYAGQVAANLVEDCVRPPREVDVHFGQAQ